MKHFNLLQILPSLNSGGVEQGTIDIAKGLKRYNIDTFVTSNGGMMLPILTRYGIKHFSLPLNSKNPITMFLNIFRLKKIINKNNINIMHVRSRAPAWSAAYCKSKKTKLISTFHNVYGHENILKKKYNLGLAKSDRIIAISEYVKQSIIEIYNIDPKKIEVIHRGIDENYYNNESVHDDEVIDFMKKNLIPFDKKIILFPGRLSAWKGQLNFLEVLKKIEQNSFFCIFVGDDNNPNYLKKLKKEISNNNLENNTKILGYQKNMPLIYKLSNVVISAPLKAEGFGRTVAESMSMKKLIIAYDFGGVKEQISELPEINRVMPNDPNELFIKIKRAINLDQEEYFNLIQPYKDIIIKKFTKKKMIDDTIKIYNSL